MSNLNHIGSFDEHLQGTLIRIYFSVCLNMHVRHTVIQVRHRCSVLCLTVNLSHADLVSRKLIYETVLTLVAVSFVNAVVALSLFSVSSLSNTFLGFSKYL